MVYAYSLNFLPILEAWQMFLKGVGVTLLFSLGTVFFGVLLGVFIAWGRISDNKIISTICRVYISAFRGTPMLIQLYLLTYGLPLALGINVNYYFSGLLSMSLNSAAYVAEVFRSGIESVPKGQIQAARSLGFSKNYTLFKIVLPQSLKSILPNIGNEFVTVVKESSIVSVIGLYDITHVSDLLKASTYKVLEALIVAALLYWILTTIFSSLVKLGEKKLNAIYAR